MNRPCLTLLRGSLAGFPGDMGNSRLIRLRCRCRQFLRVAWTIPLSLTWESNTPSKTVVVTPPVGDALPVETDPKALSDSPSSDVVGTFSELPLGPVADSPQGMTNHGSRRSLGRVPPWRLAREGPFLAERSSSSLRSFGAGCAFRNTTYRASDYASPSGEFGIPLNHPRLLEWVGVPESAGLLEMGPGRWFNTLSRDQAMDAAIQLHRDVCLMATNLDQYALSMPSHCKAQRQRC